MTNDRIIYSERCWYEGKLQPATVVIENGSIADVHLFQLEGAENVGSNILMPGVIDAHVHINEPGRTEWEGFETGTLAAAAGGSTTIVDMPLNSSPVTTTRIAFDSKKNAADNKLSVNVGFYGGLIPGNLNDIEDLIDAGVLGIKCFLVHSGIDEFPNVMKDDLEKAMPILAKRNVPLLAHCEMYTEEVDSGLKNDVGNYLKYLKSRPAKWENDAINMMIELCRKYNCPVHIVHVSSAEALKSIADARVEGLPLTAETCPHYLLFEAESIKNGDTIFKCAPPIREKANNVLLKEALKAGVLDFIATDHSPAPPEIKQIDSGNFSTGWGGIAGLQFLLSASWTALREMITVEQLIPLLTINPASFLKLDHKKGLIRKQYDADLVIWNPEKSFKVEEKQILHRHKISPYTDKLLFGQVMETVVGGVTVYSANDPAQMHHLKGVVIIKR